VPSPSFPGCVQEVRPIGLLVMLDQGVLDEKVLAVGKNNPRYNNVWNYTDIYPHMLKEITHFFSIYKDLEGKRVEIKGWHDAAYARDQVIKSVKQFQEAKLKRLRLRLNRDELASGNRKTDKRDRTLSGSGLQLPDKVGRRMKTHPSVAKALMIFGHLAARINPCPFKAEGCQQPGAPPVWGGVFLLWGSFGGGGGGGCAADAALRGWRASGPAVSQ